METENEYEELLTTLGESLADTEESRAEGPVPAPEILAVYREGRLPAAESARLEHLLSHSATARDRLAEMFPKASPGPPLALREKVLAAFDAASGSPSPSARTARRGAGRLFSLRRRPYRSPRRWGLAAVAAVAVAGAFVFLESALVQSSREPLPGDLEYAVTARGLARERGAEPGASPVAERSITAYPGTLVRIDVSAVADAASGVDFGLYRRDADGLARIESGVDLEAFRGAARLSARADDLAGPAVDPPATSLVYVVVARAGDLPGHLAVSGPQGARSVLEDGGRRRAYPLKIHLIDPGESSANP